MIQPTVGRVVWYRPSGVNGPIHAALIASVHSDYCVSLAVFDESGKPYSQCSVSLRQGDGEQSGPYAEWMPYQKGQAAKTEQLEKLVTDHAVYGAKQS